MAQNKTTIYVAGQRFPLISEDTQEYVFKIGDSVDSKIKNISLSNPKLSRDKCAIMAALDYCDDLQKATNQIESLKAQIKDYLIQEEKLRTENAQLNKTIETKQGEIIKLQHEISVLENDPHQKFIQQQKRGMNQSKTLVGGGHIQKSADIKENKDKSGRPENKNTDFNQKSLKSQDKDTQSHNVYKENKDKSGESENKYTDFNQKSLKLQDKDTQSHNVYKENKGKSGEPENKYTDFNQKSLKSQDKDTQSHNVYKENKDKSVKSENKNTDFNQKSLKSQDKDTQSHNVYKENKGKSVKSENKNTDFNQKKPKLQNSAPQNHNKYSDNNNNQENTNSNDAATEQYSLFED